MLILKALSSFKSVHNEPTNREIHLPKYINLKIGSDYIDVALSEILFLQSYGNYVKVYTMKRIYVATTTTSELERKLPSNLFTRVQNLL
ncbi:LytTR family DNA-binding domain-containing protein [Zobellia alginiliquefaciens]|uniref:LytTR family DNA-binding domain-containing protein n=1 Tax=Zobellia alginiliquefaciens TaxID=3032586 RepID=UPI0023E294D9|nr:LytTR family DNA-binding domain-containing protein [Zobellia alginiliquefaciens]